MNIAIVDDKDKLIQYAVSQGLTATFTFVGSSIIVYGTIAMQSPQASLSFMTDNSMPASYTSPPNLAALDADEQWVAHSGQHANYGSGTGYWGHLS
ncbi:hypothetical protein C8R44DRAFT_877497 [Mycena epipterygia]|nr:hypothetical protein C8R44DRAFT_877497 [Mycena epipterygia]